MTPDTPSPGKILEKFQDRIKESFEWIKAINATAQFSESLIEPKHVFFAYEYGFLRVFTGWENFIEAVFILHMTHDTNTYLNKIDNDHAMKLLCGTRPYPNWTKLDEVYRLAELFFKEPETFTLPLKQVETHLNEMLKIRNAIVHISVKAQEKFLGLIRSKIADYRIDMTPGEFLSRFQGKRRSRQTFFEHYVSYLDTVAYNLSQIS